MSAKKTSSIPKLVTLSLDKLRLDGGTQPRKELNPEVIQEYAEAYRNGVALPPVRAFWDGESYWLVDGFHRVKALRRNHLTPARVEVFAGTLNEAIWFAAGANRGHGLRRTNEDKKNAVVMATAIAATMAPQPSSRQIAEHVGVDHKTVEKYRARGAEVAFATWGTSPVDEARKGRDGRTRRVQGTSKVTGGDGGQVEPTAPPSGPVVDQLGQEITNPRIAAAFTRLGPRVEKVVGHLKAGQREWGSFHDELVADNEVLILRARSYADVRERIEEKAKQLTYEIATDTPYAICPYCKGVTSTEEVTKRCRACGGGGWLDKAAYDRAPPEKKVQLSKALFGASPGASHA